MGEAQGEEKQLKIDNLVVQKSALMTAGHLAPERRPHEEKFQAVLEKALPTRSVPASLKRRGPRHDWTQGALRAAEGTRQQQANDK